MSLLHECRWEQKSYDKNVAGLEAVEKYVTHDRLDKKSVLRDIEDTPLTPKYNELEVGGIEVGLYLELHSSWAQIYLDENGADWVDNSSLNRLLEEVTEPNQTRFIDWH